MDVVEEWKLGTINHYFKCSFPGFKVKRVDPLMEEYEHVSHHWERFRRIKDVTIIPLNLRRIGSLKHGGVPLWNIGVKYGIDRNARVLVWSLQSCD